VTAAHLERLQAVGPSVNAIVTITADAAIRHAEARATFARIFDESTR
jgi:Asp-tRNA(Asn)/Glu-tRNA(Gln) amidotransferase A subunit family amidase